MTKSNRIGLCTFFFVILISAFVYSQESQYNPINSPALSEQEQNIIEQQHISSEELSLGIGETSSGIRWHYVAFPSILIIAFLGYIEFKRLRQHGQLSQQGFQHRNTALKNYAITNLRKGYTKEQIRDALAKANYSNKDIEEAFRGVK